MQDGDGIDSHEWYICDLVKLPKDKKVLRYKWVFKKRRQKVNQELKMQGIRQEWLQRVTLWKAILQRTVVLSTIDSQYTAITEACKEAFWLKGLFSELSKDLHVSKVFCSSQSDIFLT